VNNTWLKASRPYFGKCSDSCNQWAFFTRNRQEIQLEKFYERCIHLCYRTKKLIVEVMRVQQGESLCAILETPATKQQEMEHSRLQKKSVQQDKKEKSSTVQRSSSAVGDSK